MPSTVCSMRLVGFIPICSKCQIAPVNLKLAQTNYQLRFAELRALIQDEETKFKYVLLFCTSLC